MFDSMSTDYKNETPEAARARWLSALERLTTKSPERRVKFETDSHIGIEPLYDKNIREPAQHLGYPGQYPFTRGVQPNMYRGRFWTMRQYAGFGSAKETNARYRYLLGQGQTGLSVAFHLPTQAGYDSDHPLSMGEVGKVGAAIDHIGDMRILFDQIPLDKVTTSMTVNAAATALLAMYLSVAEE